MRRKINWMRFKWLYFLISALVIIPGVYSLIRWGLKPSIDFTGGTLLEIRNTGIKESKNLEEIVQEVAGEEIKTIQTTAENTFLLRFSEFDDEEKSATTLVSLLPDNFEKEKPAS